MGVIGAFIGGGGDNNKPNRVTDQWGTIGGGSDNQVNDSYTTIGGGQSNSFNGILGTIAGGLANKITSGDQNIIGGGGSNLTDGRYAVIAGGSNNIASGMNATIGGGGAAHASFSNHATGDYSTISGGVSNFTTADYARSVAAEISSRPIPLPGIWSRMNSVQWAAGTTRLAMIPEQAMTAHLPPLAEAGVTPPVGLLQQLVGETPTLPAAGVRPYLEALATAPQATIPSLLAGERKQPQPPMAPSSGATAMISTRCHGDPTNSSPELRVDFGSSTASIFLPVLSILACTWLLVAINGIHSATGIRRPLSTG